MTDEQIDRMLVLDALIGKEIMHAQPTVFWIAAGIGFVSEPAAIDWCGAHPQYKPIRCERWERYTSDPCASKRLRDKMRADGWSYAVEWLLFEKSGVLSAYVGSFERESMDEVFVRGADTEEMAVGLAACKAKGVEV